MKRFGKHRWKLWNDMENMEEMWNDMENMDEMWKDFDNTEERKVE